MSSVKIGFPGQRSSNDETKISITDDFCYNNNVAQANVYIRMGFLRKVYGILSSQILMTVMVAALFMFIPEVKAFVHNNNWLVIVSSLGSVVVMIAMLFKRKETPTNYILLTAFTLLEASTVGVIVTFYDQLIVLEALLLTLLITVSLTLYTLQSKKDFSSWGLGLFVFLSVLFGAGLLQLFMQNQFLELLIAGGGAALFGLFIIYDTHLLMQQLSAEEYILATINLYLDIINLFLHLLRLLNAAKKN